MAKRKGSPKTGCRQVGTPNKRTRDLNIYDIKVHLVNLADWKRIEQALEALWKMGDYVNYLKMVYKAIELGIGKDKPAETETQKVVPQLPAEFLRLSDDDIASIAEQLQDAINKGKAQRMADESNEAEIIEELAEAVN
jgi:hypothetical protein